MWRKEKNGYRYLRLFTVFLIVCLWMTSMPEMVTTAYAASYSQLTGYYLLKNAESGKYLNVAGSSSSSKANVTVYSKDGTSGQLFKLQTSSSGWTVLTPACGPSCRLNVSGTSSTNGANVNIYTSSGHSTQGWYFEKVSGGYVIRSANKTSLVLAENGTANTSNVQIANYAQGKNSQIWVAESYTPAISLASGKGTVPVHGTLNITISTNPVVSHISVSSRDTSIASCSLSSSRTDRSGKAVLKITGKKKGTTSITVSSNGKTATFSVTVNGETSAITTSKINKALLHYGLDVSKVGLSNLGYSTSKYYWKYTKDSDKSSYKINVFSSLEAAQNASGYSFNGKQCFGFANLLGNYMTGIVPTASWKRYSSIKRFK